jgi:hypothetical protein
VVPVRAPAGNDPIGPIVRGPSSRLAAVAIVVALLTGACAETGEPSVTSFSGVQDLRASDPVTQTFVATNDDLMLVRVWVATYGVPGPSGTLTATLSDDTGPIREVVLPGAGLSDLTAKSLVFEPVADSAGRQFEIALAWEGVHRVGVLHNEYDAYPDGASSRGGDLRFEIGTSDRIGAAAGVVTSAVGHLVDSAASDPVFWVLWLVGLLSLGWLGVRLRRHADEPSREPAEP